MKRPRIIALYLPQYHPIPENDQWWGKGFTEWTNVAKARPLFRGHYQPKIPSELGFYDLRLGESREAQAKLAQESGVDAFAYWHYWFAGRRLIERPFNEVLESGRPDFPFCLFWANHSWLAKTWDKNKPNKMLLEQTYPGKDDYINHFNYALKAFKDYRYVKIGNKPVFGIYKPEDIPDLNVMMNIWNAMAKENGFDGVYFMSYSFNIKNYHKCQGLGMDANILDVKDESDGMANPFNDFITRVIGKLRLNSLYRLKLADYKKYVRTAEKIFSEDENATICILPNYDHSPRSGKRAPIMIDSTPENWKVLLGKMKHILDKRTKNNDFLIIKSWNEWGEGNYLEPDIKYGRGYLDAIKEVFGRTI